MPIQLDKILADIAEEKLLHPNYPNASKKDTDDAWIRVGKKNKLSVHEARSIFKVLQKKYEQERVKDSSAWKLFAVMDEIHRKVEIKPEVKHEDEEAEEEHEMPMEEDEEYEMLEVQEEEEHGAPVATGGSASDSESPTKSMKSNSSTGSPEKDERPLIKTMATPKSAAIAIEPKKILNALPPSGKTPNVHVTSSAAAAAALQKKGIIMKKTTPTTASPAAAKMQPAHMTSQHTKTTPVRAGSSMLEVGKTIQLPDSIKRKLSEEQSPQQSVKRSNLSQAVSAAQSQQKQAQSTVNQSQTTPANVSNSKAEKEDQQQTQPTTPTTSTTHGGINIITIPGNTTRTDLRNGDIVSASAAVANASNTTTTTSSSTNGYSPRIEDIDFRNDIIFDAGTSGSTTVNGTVQHGTVNRLNTGSGGTTDIINLGNFNNSLPPTFFKNLCNSSRHEALGLYVANVMNRLSTRTSAKLELGILRAIIDAQSEELQQ